MNTDNNTFRPGNNFHYNACVGKNGFNDISSYEDGYHDAVNILFEQLIKERKYHVDTLVYPILFSARHRIELFFKKFVDRLEKLNALKDRKYNRIPRKNIHDLRILWEYVEELSQVDKRYSEDIIDLNDFIKDYFDIDLTGETFRYPFNNNNQQHLEDRSRINLLVFKEQYDSMSQLINYIDKYSYEMIEEYYQKTYVGELSRYEIKDISIKLPDHSKWNTAIFKDTINHLREEYGISQRKLSQTIDVIKNHREFSRNIGLSVKVTEINRKTYQKVKQVRSEIMQKDIDTYPETVGTLIGYLDDILNKESCAVLRTFDEIGYHTLYSEEYDRHVEYYLSFPQYIYELTDIILKNNAIDNIEAGMRICGQDHLL